MGRPGKRSSDGYPQGHIFFMWRYVECRQKLEEIFRRILEVTFFKYLSINKMSEQYNLTITEALEYLQHLFEDYSESDYNDDCLSVWRRWISASKWKKFNSDEENDTNDNSTSALTIAGPSHHNGDEKLSVLNKNSPYCIRWKRNIEISNKRHLHSEKIEKKISSNVLIQTGKRRSWQRWDIWNVVEIGSSNKGRKAQLTVLK